MKNYKYSVKGKLLNPVKSYYIKISTRPGKYMIDFTFQEIIRFYLYLYDYI